MACSQRAEPENKVPAPGGCLGRSRQSLGKKGKFVGYRKNIGVRVEREQGVIGRQ